MAIGAITFIRYLAPRRGVRQRIISMAGPTAYTGTGGDTLTAADVKLNAIDSINFELPHPLVDRQYIYNKTTGKIQIQVPSTGLELANGVNCSADIVRALVSGR